jgi:hypothetical protein
VVPYAVPVYAGGYYGDVDPYYGNGYAPQQPPNVTVVVPQQPTPSVVINQHYTPPETAQPTLREYSSGELPESRLKVYEGPESGTGEAKPPQKAPAPQAAAPQTAEASESQPTIYLIALKDTTVRQAIGHWTDGTTLHYVTPKASVNRVSLDMVDREMTVRLNAERKLEFDFTPSVRQKE